MDGVNEKLHKKPVLFYTFVEYLNRLFVQPEYNC